MAKLRVDKIAAPIVKDEFTGSVHFDGTGDYLSVADHSDLDFGTGDFTIEFWAYAKTSELHDGYVGKRNTGSFNNNSWRIAYNNTYDNINLLHADSGGDFTAAAAPAPGQSWSHYAFTRESGTLRVFKDGVLSTSATGWTYDFSNDYDLLIGANITSDYYLDGYISNLRICKGHAVYTENFTPPTRELPVHKAPPKGVVFPAADNVTVLLACQDAYNPLTDASGRHTITGAGNLGGVLGQELVTNGQFTQNTNDWAATIVSGSITFTRDTTVFSGGGIKVTTGGGQSHVTQTLTGLVVGARYTFSADLYTPSSNPGTDVATISIVNAGYTSSNAVSTDTNGVIQRKSFTFTASSTSQVIYLSVVRANYSTFAPGGSVGYFDNISVTADIPVTDANPGLLRKTNTTSTITETTGSVFFDNSGDYLVPPVDDDELILGDTYSIEWWHYLSEIGTGDKRHGFIMAASAETTNTNESGGLAIYAENDGSQQRLRVRANNTGSDVTTPTGDILAGVWQHCAVQVNNNFCEIYIDGVLRVSGNTNGSVTQRIRRIGSVYFANSDYDTHGYISNLRICKGHVVYTSQFIPPTRELEAHTGSVDDRTVLLCCYDGENIFAEKTGRILRAVGDRLSSPTPTATDSPIGITTHNPGLTREVDPVEGPTFGGGAGFVSQNWLTLPKGTTAERMPNFATNAVTSGGTRAVYHSGETPTTSTYDTLEYLNIATLGSVNDFGNLSNQKLNQVACSSNTRGLFATGYTPSPASGNSFIDYVTIMSTGDAKDFGDLTFTTYVPDACSNQIRGFVAGGAAAPNYSGLDNIDYVTISTLGNGTDFGNLIDARHSLTGLASPTRGIFGAGQTNVNTIEYITIASTGNGSDFGDLLLGRAGCAGASSSTRGLFAGGYTATPAVRNIIEFITIATMGNSQDFGDLTAVRRFAGATSSTTRGVFIAGYNPSMTNTIDYVNIQTTGNAVDFGETINKTQSSACSNGHGGLG